MRRSDRTRKMDYATDALDRAAGMASSGAVYPDNPAWVRRAIRETKRGLKHLEDVRDARVRG